MIELFLTIMTKTQNLLLPINLFLKSNIHGLHFHFKNYMFYFVYSKFFKSACAFFLPYSLTSMLCIIGLCQWKLIPPLKFLQLVLNQHFSITINLKKHFTLTFYFELTKPFSKLHFKKSLFRLQFQQKFSLHNHANFQ